MAMFMNTECVRQEPISVEEQARIGATHAEPCACGAPMSVGEFEAFGYCGTCYWNNASLNNTILLQP